MNNPIFLLFAGLKGLKATAPFIKFHSFPWNIQQCGKKT